jgi:hypothetical protein
MCKMWPAIYQKHGAKGIKFDEFLFCANSYETLKYKGCDTILLDFSKFYLMVTFRYCTH